MPSKSDSKSAVTTAKPRSSKSLKPKVRTFVLDTSVLLSDPNALLRFAEHEVVIPVVVLAELEAKRNHLEIGFFARTALRLLDDLRVSNGRLDVPIELPGGGKLRVELNHTDESALPVGLRLGDNDTRILAVAKNLSIEGREVVIVSKDLPMRVKASAAGIEAEEYRAELAASDGWSGIVDIHVAAEQINELFENGMLALPEASEIPINAGVVLHAGKTSALARCVGRGVVRLVKGDREAFGLHGRSAEQRIALDLLLDEEIGIISLGGKAGTGKSALAIAAGLEAVLERRSHKKVMIFRPLYAVGGQELGFLPGTEAEKMSPWGQAVFDTLGAIASEALVKEVIERDLIEVLPLTHIRGRSLHDAFVIVDEAQSLERNVLLTVLSRIGKGSRVVLTHDVAQRDNLRVGRHDGVVAVVDKLKGHPLFAHVTLTRSERSAIAALVTELLEESSV